MKIIQTAIKLPRVGNDTLKLVLSSGVRQGVSTSKQCYGSPGVK